MGNLLYFLPSLEIPRKWRELSLWRWELCRTLFNYFSKVIMDWVSFTLLYSRVKLNPGQIANSNCRCGHFRFFLRLKRFTSRFLVFRILSGIRGVCCSASLDTERNFTRQYSVLQSHGFCTLRKRAWFVCFETWPGNSSRRWLHRNWRASMFFCFFSKELGFSTDLPQSKRASEH